MTTDDPHAIPPVGLIAGKYELLRLIGRGGMGSVWEGRHASLGNRVAIKFIEAESSNNPEARERFYKEAKAAAEIESKHAIKIYDHGVTGDGRPYIVMEMLLGESLDARLQRLGHLSPEETVRIIQQVCRALHRAHERGIVHRDLKPENIFLVRTPDEDDEFAKVLDFGIAKKATPGAMDISSGTKTGMLLGTPFYMSPEQARGLRNVDHRSDLWALGVIVFRCLCGGLPFDGESLGDLLVKICTGPIPVPSQRVPGLPPTIDAWMARALDRAPESRFQTAQELADALSFACGVTQKRLSHSPSSGSYRPPYEGRTSRPPVSSLASLHAQPAAATSAPFTAPTPRPASSSKGLLAGVTAGALLVGFGLVVTFAPKFLGGGAKSAAPTTTTTMPVAAGPIPVSPPVSTVAAKATAAAMTSAAHVAPAASSAQPVPLAPTATQSATSSSKPTKPDGKPTKLPALSPTATVPPLSPTANAPPSWTKPPAPKSTPANESPGY